MFIFIFKCFKIVNNIIIIWDSKGWFILGMKNNGSPIPSLGEELGGMLLKGTMESRWRLKTVNAGHAFRGIERIGILVTYCDAEDRELLDRRQIVKRQLGVLPSFRIIKGGL